MCQPSEDDWRRTKSNVLSATGVCSTVNAIPRGISATRSFDLRRKCATLRSVDHSATKTEMLDRPFARLRWGVGDRFRVKSSTDRCVDSLLREDCFTLFGSKVSRIQALPSRKQHGERRPDRASAVHTALRSWLAETRSDHAAVSGFLLLRGFITHRAEAQIYRTSGNY